MSKSHQENTGPLDGQRLKEAIMIDEAISEILNDSSPSVFHTFPGDFYAFAEPPQRYYAWLGQQQTQARKRDSLKGICYLTHLMI